MLLINCRRTSRWLGIGLLTLLACCLGLFTSSNVDAFENSESLRSSKPPNIVFFLVDDMGWQDTSVPFHTEVTKTNQRYRTPNMSALADSGMKFTQAYACALCSPTRISLMTGWNAARHRVTNWTLRKNRAYEHENPKLKAPRWNINGLSPVANTERTVCADTLPMLLKRAGYRTIHVGKAHFGADGMAGEDPTQLGFDINIGGHCAGGPGSYYGTNNFSAAFRKGDRIWDVPGLEKYHGQEINLTEALTIEANETMDAAVAAGQPFYLYMAHYAVHAPFEADTRFIKKYKDSGLKGLPATFASMIESMDWSLGKILANLQRHGIEDETIVVFMSDNGSPRNTPRNLPLRGHKLTPYEGGVRVPLIVRWPGVVQPASKTDTYVIVEDLFPTLLEMAGVNSSPAAKNNVDGVSFVSTLKQEADGDTNRALYWHYPNTYGQPPYSSIRVGDWKLIFHYTERKTELFNLRDDLSETTNLAATHPDKAADLTQRLMNFLVKVKAQTPLEKSTGLPIPPPGMSKEELKRTISSSDNSTSTPKQIDVWLLGGQSNMQGIGKVANLPETIPAKIPHCQFWNGQKFEPFVLGKTKSSARPGEFGPEVGLGLALASQKQPAFLVKYYASGMPLHHGFDGGKWIGNTLEAGRRNFYPGQSATDQNMGILYRQMLERYRSAIRNLRSDGHQPVVRGFCWMQGEQDSKQALSATTYAANLKRLRDRLASDLGLTSLPMVFGQVLPHEPALKRFAYRDTIRAQMAAADFESGDSVSIPLAKMISTDGFGLLPDTVHYNAKGQLKLGKAMAQGLSELELNPTKN